MDRPPHDPLRDTGAHSDYNQSAKDHGAHESMDWSGGGWWGIWKQ